MKAVFRTLASIACLNAACVVAEASAQEHTPPAHATADSTDAPATVGDEIIVRGRRMSEIDSNIRIEIDKFVTQIAAPATGRGYARWHRDVCVSIQNLERTAAQYLVDRISRLAADVGLVPGEPGCNPSVIIGFSADGKETARQVIEENPRLLRPTAEGGMQSGLEAMQVFAESDKPVRWWHVSVPVDARFGIPTIRMPGQALTEHSTVTVEGPSRIHAGLRDDLAYAIIIVDSRKLQGQGTTWEQLGDYLAFVSLAQVDLSADPSAFDSILNLFSNPKAYSGLTDWDRSYIRALYRFDQERDPRMQRNELVNTMARTPAEK